MAVGCEVFPARSVVSWAVPEDVFDCLNCFAALAGDLFGCVLWEEKKIHYQLQGPAAVLLPVRVSSAQSVVASASEGLLMPTPHCLMSFIANRSRTKNNPGRLRQFPI